MEQEIRKLLDLALECRVGLLALLARAPRESLAYDSLHSAKYTLESVTEYLIEAHGQAVLATYLADQVVERAG